MADPHPAEELHARGTPVAAVDRSPCRWPNQSGSMTTKLAVVLIALVARLEDGLGGVLASLPSSPEGHALCRSSRMLLQEFLSPLGGTSSLCADSLVEVASVQRNCSLFESQVGLSQPSGTVPCRPRRVW